MCCRVLQCVVAWCSMLQCDCNVLQSVAVCCSMMQYVAEWLQSDADKMHCLNAANCSELQCVTVCCSELQYVAMCCYVLQCVADKVDCLNAASCSELQCVAACCSVLQTRRTVSTKKGGKCKRCEGHFNFKKLFQFFKWRGHTARILGQIKKTLIVSCITHLKNWNNFWNVIFTVCKNWNEKWMKFLPASNCRRWRGRTERTWDRQTRTE